MAEDPDLESAYALETPEDNLRLYRAWAETYDADFVAATSYALPGTVARAYLEAGGGWPCLDVGCGTGALARHLPPEAVLDGLDLSPEMLAVARSGGRYRTLVEANLLAPLPLGDAAYRGLISSGTFTHGHVGPEPLPELLRILAPGAVAAISVRPHVWEDKGFGAALGALARAGRVSAPRTPEVPVYADPARAPEGHGADTALVVTFRRL